MTPRPAPKFGRPSPPPLGNPEPMGPKAKPPAPNPDDAPDSGGLVTLDMLDYHGEEERCDACQNYTAPDQCAVDPSTPVTAGAHCEAFKGSGGQGAEEGAGAAEGGAPPDEF